VRERRSRELECVVSNNSIYLRRRQLLHRILGRPAVRTSSSGRRYTATTYIPTTGTVLEEAEGCDRAEVQDGDHDDGRSGCF